MANARVDWRQGAQPQRITVSLLLPGSSTAAQWRDFLQSKRQFWPTLTTCHASLAHYVLMPCNASVAKCNQSTFGTLSIFAGMSWPRKSKCSHPLVLLVSSCGITYLFSSIDRIHSRKGNTKVWISRRCFFFSPSPHCSRQLRSSSCKTSQKEVNFSSPRNNQNKTTAQNPKKQHKTNK